MGEYLILETITDPLLKDSASVIVKLSAARFLWFKKKRKKELY